jgi:hypothetical protein
MRLITGESTPHYMFYPHAAAGLAKHFPDAKLLAVLREPAARAFSEWRMNTDRGRETLSFEEALAAEEGRLDGEWNRSVQDTGYWSKNLAEFSYKKRGLYLEQILRLEQHFPRENILAMRSGELWQDTGMALGRIEEFLGLSPWQPKEVVPENVGTNKTKPAPETTACLRDYFRPYDQALFDHLGWEHGWDGHM